MPLALTASSMDTITGAVDTVTTMTSSVFDLIVANPLLVVFVASSLLGVGIGVFKKLKGAAK